MAVSGGSEPQPLWADEPAFTGPVINPEPLALGAPGDATLVRVAVLVAWMAAGLLIAFFMHRRGHGFRPLAALGVVLGPVLATLAFDAARHRDRAARPFVVRRGESAGGPVDVLVAIEGRAEGATAALPLLHVLGNRIGRITVARAIDYEDLDLGHDSYEQAARVLDLELSTLFLGEHRPAAVLVPGRPPRCFVEHAAEAGYDLVVVVTGPRPRPSLARAAAGAEVPLVLVPDRGTTGRR
jgi:hypothetical protein